MYMYFKSFAVAFLAMFAGQTIAQQKTPIMGWSSWNTYRIHINDSLIERQAKAMVDRGLKAAGYEYVNVDDGYFGYRDAGGALHTHPVRFPHGLKALVDSIHALGLKAGIYSDAGSNTCGSIWDHDQNGIGVGLYGHERQDADWFFNKLGFDFIKIDYCGAGQELDLDEQERYEEICRAIKSVAQKPVEVNLCRWAFPGTWAADIATSWRISPDIDASWGAVKAIIAKNLYLSAFARGGHFNDMDMLEIGRGLPMNEEEVHFGLWCMMSSPLLIGCDLTKIPDASLRLLKNPELIALNQDVLARQAHVVSRQGEGFVLVKDLRSDRGLVRAVALYNAGDAPHRFSVSAEVLELAGKLRLRDLVRRRNLKAVSDSIVMDVPARSVRILRVEGRKRLEPGLYEAEWAFLPRYDDLGKRKKSIRCVYDEQASGKVRLGFLGGSADNTAIWDRVWSDEGGRYDMTICYKPEKGRKLEVAVNGRVVRFDSLPESGKVVLPVVLRKGYNKVVMGSPYCWAVDVDCFTLSRR